MGIPIIGDIMAANARNKHSEKVAGIQNKSAKQAWKYNKKVGRDNHNFKVESLEVLKRNNANNADYLFSNEMDQWRFGERMRIRRQNTEMEAYNASISEATTQISFNNMAYMNAQMQQQRSYREQLVGIRFDEEGTERDFLAASAGIAFRTN